MDKKTIERFKSEYSTKCLFGTCPDCSRIVDSVGIHDIREYAIYEYTEEEECDDCHGDGTKRHECWECGGSGEVEEKCEECDGSGQVPDVCGDEKFIKSRYEIKKSAENTLTPSLHSGN